jgi:hypothetical protein
MGLGGSLAAIWDYFRKIALPVGISTIVSPRYGRPSAASNLGLAAEMNTSLVEIETLASKYDDERMQFWQARPAFCRLRPDPGEAPPRHKNGVQHGLGQAIPGWQL